ncbi:uncharacterized protein DUF4105 [Dyadobacter jejuensis]|uniref:Uncharacterized protein DUF4105 n=1 Tax=Dyadobacter jejuensis TaxID=1082580 RepID=A0A316AL29_9BACT|nr:DUF4105 domain-containing protein [Dyadobacter jejuensis]PWJ58202.1 uncharacterized protein DUF4105 [Dyadobacter jejuensis]
MFYQRKSFVFYIVWTTLLFILPGAITQAQTLSPDARVSLVTVGPGTELYSGFGHSVLWFSDPATGMDRAYSYGTFSFETGNFYVKFLRGTLPYTISVAPLAPQAAYWQSENRSIKQQVLNLSPSQKEKLYQYLETNYLPENREYQYKFFFDNCATRLGLALQMACGDSLIYPGYTAEKRSFREWIDKYAYVQNPWADFGMDLAIGAPSDELASPMQATFLPDNLSAAFAAATLKTDSLTVPLVANETILYAASPVAYETVFTPKNTFWALAVLVVLFTVWQIKKNKLNFILDKILFTICGVMGWFILLLWFGTNHGVTSFNFDILWAFPLWIPIVYMFSKNKRPVWFQFFLVFYGFLLLCATGILEKHNLVLIPILVMLITRVYYINNSLSNIPIEGEMQHEPRTAHKEDH